MGLIFSNGFDHLFPEARQFGFPRWHHRAPALEGTSGRGGGARLNVYVSGGHELGLDDEEDAGGQVDVDVAGDLWIGQYIAAPGTAEFSSGDGIACLAGLYIDGVRALTLWANFASSENDGLAAHAIALKAGDAEIRTSNNATPAAGTTLAVSDPGVFSAAGGTSGSAHLILGIIRGEGSGRVQVLVDGDLALDQDGIDELDVNEGPFTKVAFEWAGSINAVSHRRQTFDDLWIADEVSLGDARCLIRTTEAQGSYSDGIPTGEAAGWEAVGDIPPNMSSYITMAGGDRDSHLYEDGPDGDRAAVVGVTVRSVLTNPDFDLAVFHRDGGTDREVGELPAEVVADSTRFVAIPENPATEERWTLADLDGVEFGYEVKP